MTHPFSDVPEDGALIEVADGIFWARLPLPFQLNHVNIYFIEDGDGFAVLDTGINTAKCKQSWAKLLAGPLQGKRLTRMIVTHHHPDHIGLAGWLAKDQGLPLLTTATAYLQANALLQDHSDQVLDVHAGFFKSHGLGPEAMQMVEMLNLDYKRSVLPLPLTYLRLMQGDTLKIGQRRFQVLTADGHAPEQAMLYLPDENLLFAADQVLARISPNIGVFPDSPDADPLGHYLRALRQIMAGLPDDTFVLPGHELPFYGLPRRCSELVAHHDDRCLEVLQACADTGKTTLELTHILFPRALDVHQMGFAFTETLAHANRLLRRGTLRAAMQAGVQRFETV
ncbi:MAG: MBL fold metallo-hydrolase [Rhodobacteraceae bacterium]|nr:MBL fold metallo-hydrolase [Paracoccaceae bacterium]